MAAQHFRPPTSSRTSAPPWNTSQLFFDFVQLRGRDGSDILSLEPISPEVGVSDHKGPQKRALPEPSPENHSVRRAAHIKADAVQNLVLAVAHAKIRSGSSLDCQPVFSFWSMVQFESYRSLKKKKSAVKTRSTRSPEK